MNNPVLRLVLALLTGGLSCDECSGQPAGTPAPSFEASRVLPSGRDRQIPLAPGLLISIYGEHLGPIVGCEGHTDPNRREAYPKELCETQVMVGGIPAGLLYVQEHQINFKVPQETPEEGATAVQVIYKGQASSPATLPLGSEPVALSLESSASVGMPVWLKVSLPGGDPSVRYPFHVVPAYFSCHEVEVRRDGILLPRIATRAIGGIAISGPLCGSMSLPAESHHPGRIPLHLQYRFNLPGTYEVRYTMRNDPHIRSTPSIQSAWIPIEIAPGAESSRVQWLRERSASAPIDATGLLTDYLPSILGIPDHLSLELLCPYLYHPDYLVREFVLQGLVYWPESEAEAAVLDAVRLRGPTEEAIRFLTRGPELAAAKARFLLQNAIPYFRSDSLVTLRGAVAAIYRADLPQDPSIDPALRARAETAFLQAAEHIVGAADTQTVNDYTSALGVIKDPRANAVLWDFINRDITREQAMIALTWRHSGPDLSRLAQLTFAPAGGGNRDSDVCSLPYALHQAYGEAAIPYLETMLARSEFTCVQTNSARELKLAGRSPGLRPEVR